MEVPDKAWTQFSLAAVNLIDADPENTNINSLALLMVWYSTLPSEMYFEILGDAQDIGIPN